MRNMCSELRSKWNSIPPAFRGDDYGLYLLPPCSWRCQIAIYPKRLGVTPIFEAIIVLCDRNWV